MNVARFYLPPPAWKGEEVVLIGEEARHCAQVTRHREGDAISLFDGCGRFANGMIAAMSKDSVRVTVGEMVVQPSPSRPITLLQGIVKGDTMDWIIEKAVELGVQRVVPVITQRSIVRLNAADAGRKRDKWQRVALEACKQCGQTWLPQVAQPCTLEMALAETAPAALRLVTSLEPGATPFREILRAAQHDPQRYSVDAYVIAIGPEGDFTPEEYQSFRDLGWLPWSLGSLTLRSETAAICALSILSYELHSD